MSILDQLSSSVGAMTQDANVRAAEQCLAEPALLADIIGGLGRKNVRLAGDCAEVMTKVAEAKPELIAPLAELLFVLLRHNNGRVRWEAAHAYGLVAGLRPDHVGGKLAELARMFRADQSVIVRDHLADAVANYGATGPKPAAAAFPILREMTTLWEGKHAARVLAALPRLIRQMPKLAPAGRELALAFQDHPRPSVRKAAKAVLKATVAAPSTAR